MSFKISTSLAERSDLSSLSGIVNILNSSKGDVLFNR